jgi:16S rRNA (uracil1498-N3)-methyltransferase
MVRRASPGDIIVLRSDDGFTARGRVATIADSYLEVEILERIEKAVQQVDIILCCSLLKGKYFDILVEQVVEIGVSRIIPFLSERTVPSLGDSQSRLARWNRKAREAAKQSLREKVPVVEPVCAVNELISRAWEGVKLLAHPGADRSLRQFLREHRGDPVIILVGPEGGFSAKELALAADAGWSAVNFGATLMRAATAAAVLSAIVLYEWSDKDENSG